MVRTAWRYASVILILVVKIQGNACAQLVLRDHTVAQVISIYYCSCEIKIIKLF